METIGGISIGNVREPKRLIPGSDQAFQCVVDLQLPGGQLETHPYVANKDDHVPTGQYVYQQIINGEAGEIVDYVMPVPSEEDLATGVRHHRKLVLSQLDSIVTNPLRWAEVTEEQKIEVAAFRQALLDVPQQEGFPTDIKWPEAPSFLGIQAPF